MLPPSIVSISRLHRETAAVLREAAKSDHPIFVTQYACVTAVLLPRQMYDRLLRAADKGSAPTGKPNVPSPLASPLTIFGPLPPRTRFLTRKGLSVDAELAAFLMEEGEEVRPILEHWEERREDQDDDDDDDDDE